jgi:hypothetical protein
LPLILLQKSPMSSFVRSAPNRPMAFPFVESPVRPC